MANNGTDFAQRAENLLQGRMETIKTLGDLIDQRAELDTRVETAAQKALEAGWTKKELSELGVPVPRQASGARRGPAKRGRVNGATETHPEIHHNTDQGAVPVHHG
ncbi:hypothetical protein ACNQR7_32655 [Mycolicibacterium senegalense]|uniref:hypothetical protein n=1 Tax=Mycolicibacterium senegalense TaxID=1796 RepID=UPI003AAB13E8